MAVLGYRRILSASMVTFLTLDTAAMAGRVYVRTKMKSRSFGYYRRQVGYVIHCAMGFTSMSYGYAAEEESPHYDQREALRYYFANQLCVYISSGLVKLAVAMVLYRLAASKRLRWALIASMAIVGVWTVVMTLYTSWLCAAKGSSNYAGSDTCRNIGYFRTISNIFIDYFYALLPVYILWNIQMSLKLKLTVLLLLGLGAFASSATIVKLVVIIKLTHASKAEEEGLHYDLLLWADIELGLAIFCASAAALRPLLKQVPGLWDVFRSHRSHGKSHATDSALHGQPYRTIDHNNDNELDRLDLMGRSTSLAAASSYASDTREKDKVGVGVVV
ncbi:hypothetical protein SLS62_003667 [Diatrype stigma]|uniref:Rhodopsin domain-containing protein n=1 Tax=Diatrype stigma TaxID=117547 RepID=A0AAN9US28_9PEZI